MYKLFIISFLLLRACGCPDNVTGCGLSVLCTIEGNISFSQTEYQYVKNIEYDKIVVASNEIGGNAILFSIAHNKPQSTFVFYGLNFNDTLQISGYSFGVENLNECGYKMVLKTLPHISYHTFNDITATLQHTNCQYAIKITL